MPTKNVISSFIFHLEKLGHCDFLIEQLKKLNLMKILMHVTFNFFVFLKNWFKICFNWFLLLFTFNRYRSCFYMYMNSVFNLALLKCLVILQTFPFSHLMPLAFTVALEQINVGWGALHFLNIKSFVHKKV